MPLPIQRLSCYYFLSFKYWVCRIPSTNIFFLMLSFLCKDTPSLWKAACQQKNVTGKWCSFKKCCLLGYMKNNIQKFRIMYKKTQVSRISFFCNSSLLILVDLLLRMLSRISGHKRFGKLPTGTCPCAYQESNLTQRQKRKKIVWA